MLKKIYSLFFKHSLTLHILILVLALSTLSCNPQKRKKESDGKQVLTVSILPEKTFVEKIAGDDFKINLLLPPGESPVTFTLLPSQLVDITKSVLWLKMGHVAFEYSWDEKIREINKKMKVVNLSEELELIHAKVFESEKQGLSAGINPHTWMSPMLVIKMAGRIADELSLINPERKEFYHNNYLTFAREIDELDKKVRTLLEPYRGRSFIMFHPSLAYFARDYGLTEHSLEPGGKEPTPQRMRQLIELAKRESIPVIYIQSDLDREQARVFAEEINGKIEEMWPLNPDWEANLMNITKQLINNF